MTLQKRLGRGLFLWLLILGFRLAAGTDDYLIDVWDNENGLGDSTVDAIAQTPEGYLWLGTYNGLKRFDGVRFVNFDPFNTPGLKHERIRQLFTDANGTLWINTFDGFMTTWRNGVFTDEAGWPGGAGKMISSSSNRLVFATASSLVERLGGANEPSRWQVIRPVGRLIRSACVDAAGDIWYITGNHHLYRLQGDQSEMLASDRGLPGQQANCLTTDSAGRLWVGTDAGAAKWDGLNFQIQTPADEEPLEVTTIALNPLGGCWVLANGRLRLCQDKHWLSEAMAWPNATLLNAYQDRDCNTWFCHYGKGLLLAGTNGVIRTINGSDGLPGNRVLCWFQDREGNIWVGTDHGGLARLRQRQFKVINPTDDPATKVSMSVCENPPGTVWIGSLGGGISRWQNDFSTNFPFSSINDNGSVFSICPDQQPGCFWLSAGNEDLYRFANGKISKPIWSVHGVKALLRDRHSRLWLGLREGLACYADDNLRHLGTLDGFQRSDVRSLAEDAHGNIWAGTATGELYRFGDQNVKPGAVASGTMYHPTDRWSRQPIWAICPDQDTLWLGTFRGGLLRFRDGQFTRYTAEKGLPNDVICQILPDHQGNLWLGTYGGIFRVSKTELNAAAQDQTRSIAWVTYGRLDGLPTLACSGGYQPACWPGTDGRLWFATLKGVVAVQPNGLPRNLQAPSVLVEEVFVDGRILELPHANLGFASVQEANLAIGPGKHYVEFHYTGLSFTAPEQVRFRYRLRGLDDHWVEAGARRFAPYTFLRPGDYHFEVVACNSEGLWNIQAGALRLRIQPHFWETWWFLLVMGVLAVGALALAIRRAATRKLRQQMERLEQQQALERDRARIAKDIHDDLGAGLTQIGLLAELSRRAPPEKLGNRLNQISETARELTGAMDEIVWAVNPRNDTLDGLAMYLCKFGQEFLSLAGIRCRLDVPVQLPSRSLTAEIRHNLFLAVKETLNNVVKHAGATEVWITLIPHPAKLTIVIQDNGRGFMPKGEGAGANNRLTAGNGLPNMEKRLQGIGGFVVFRSTPGQGVTVELTAPFVDPKSPLMVIATQAAVAHSPHRPETMNDPA